MPKKDDMSEFPEVGGQWLTASPVRPTPNYNCAAWRRVRRTEVGCIPQVADTIGHPTRVEALDRWLHAAFATLGYEPGP